MQPASVPTHLLPRRTGTAPWPGPSQSPGSYALGPTGDCSFPFAYTRARILSQGLLAHLVRESVTRGLAPRSARFACRHRLSCAGELTNYSDPAKGSNAAPKTAPAQEPLPEKQLTVVSSVARLTAPATKEIPPAIGTAGRQMPRAMCPCPLVTVPSRFRAASASSVAEEDVAQRHARAVCSSRLAGVNRPFSVFTLWTWPGPSGLPSPPE